MAISELSQPKRDFLLQCVLEGEVLAATAIRSGLPALPSAKSAKVDEVRAHLTKLFDLPQGSASRGTRK